jgi:prepilin-type N-terminal cleavage/methylation domain-containing protein
MKSRDPFTWGFSLVELLCVIGIISVLASMMLAPMGKALSKARGLVGSIEEDAHIAEIKTKYQAYRLAHKEHGRLDLNAFIKACDLSWKCRQWLHSKQVKYTSFSASDPLETVILVFNGRIGKQQTTSIYRLSSLLEIPTLRGE